MQTKPKEILLSEYLRMEIAKKGQATTLFFTLFACFTVISPFGTIQFKTIIQSIAIISFIFLIGRYLLFNKIRTKNAMTDQEWSLTKFLAILNAILWSAILTIAAYEHQLLGLHYVTISTLLAGIVGASIVTLSYSNLLFVSYQLIMLVPQAILIIYFSFTKSTDHLPLIFLYVLFLAYQIKQSIAYRAELIKVFDYQYDLEKSNLELKNSQEALVSQTTKLLHTSRLAALGEVSASIAHEVNNPLMVISGSVAQLKRGINDKANSKQPLDESELIQLNSLLEKIKKSADRVTNIYGGIKHFGAQSDLTPKESVPLEIIFQDTLSFSMELFNSHFIQFHIDDIPKISIFCNSVQISQVLINLLKNAVDAIIDQQAKSNFNDNPINNHWIKVNFLIENQDSLKILITNSGNKIPDSQASKMFQPFFTTKTSGKGTGLGLSISMTIIEEHNGLLTYEQSEPFTTFCIKLPIA